MRSAGRRRPGCVPGPWWDGRREQLRTAVPAGPHRGRPVAAPVLDAPSRRSSPTPAGRCSCSPARAPARPPRSSRPSSPGSSAGARPRAGARPDVRPPGGGRAARPHHRPARPRHQGAAGPHLPLLRLRRCCAARRRCAASRRRGCSSGPEQDLVVRELLAGDLEAGAAGWPERLRAGAADPRLRPGAARPAAARLRARRDRRRARRGSAARRAATTGGRRPGSCGSTPGSPRCATPAAYDPAELIRAVVGLLAARAGAARRRAGRPPARLRRRAAGHRPGPGRAAAAAVPAAAATWSRSATPTSRSTASAAPTSPASASSPSGSAPPTARRRRCVALTHLPPVRVRRCSPRSRRVAARSRRSARGTATCCPRWRPADGERLGRRAALGGQEAAYVAARLRQAHLVDGVPWSRMAVLVRSTVTSLPVLRRAHGRGRRAGRGARRGGAAGRAAGGPAAAARCCAARSGPRRSTRTRAVELLTLALSAAPTCWRCAGCARSCAAPSSPPVGGARPGAARRGAARTRSELIALDPHVVRPAGERVAGCSPSPATAAAEPGATAEDVLWAVWQRTGLAVSAGSGRASTAAGRARPPTATSTRWWRCSRPRPGSATGCPAAGPEVFLDHLLGQQIPGDTCAPRGSGRRGGRRSLTAHASKGLEWDVVCVAGVQEGIWPDLRLRGSFLGSRAAGRPAAPGGVPLATVVATAATLSRLLDEERRLFYVAVTRARRALLVTAVDQRARGPERRPGSSTSSTRSPREATSRPRHRRYAGRCRLTGLVAELRQRRPPTPASTTPRALEPRRRGTGRARRGRCPRRRPGVWWGLAALSDDRPVRDPESRSRSARPRSSRSGGASCAGSSSTSAAPTRRRRAERRHPGARGRRARRPGAEHRGGAAAPGSRRLLPTGRPRPGWVAGNGSARRPRAMVRRLAAWLAANRRELVAAELAFEATVGRAALGGRVDRLERDDRRPRPWSSTSRPDRASRAGRRARRAPPARGLPARRRGTAPSRAGPDRERRRGAGAGRRRPAARAARVQAQPPLSTSDDPGWARQLVLRGRRGDGRVGLPTPSTTATARCARCDQLPGAGRRPGGDVMSRRAALHRPPVEPSRRRPAASPAHAGRAGQPARRVAPPTAEQAGRSRRRCGRTSSWRAPARARPRRWACASSGWSPTGWSSRTACSASRSPARRRPSSASGSAGCCAGCGTRTTRRRSSTDGRRARLAHRRADGVDVPLATPRRWSASTRCGSASSRGTRLLGEAVSWQYAAQVVEAYDGADGRGRPGRHHGHRRRAGAAPASWPSTCATADDVRALTERVRAPARSAAAGAGPAHGGLLQDVRELRRPARGPACAAAAGASATRDLKRAPRRDGLRRPGGASPRASLATHPEVGEIERGRFGAVLLDEYQDTGEAQRVLLTSLFGAGTR